MAEPRGDNAARIGHAMFDLPGFITILDVTDTRVLAVRLDELDVPEVVMLELIKPMSRE